MHPCPAATWLAVLAAGCLASGCDDPERPAFVPRSWRGVYDPSAGGVDAFSFTPESPPSGLQFVVLAVGLEPTSGNLQAEVALGNTRHVAVHGPAAVGFRDFAPAGVKSAFTVCDDPEADPQVSACYIDYRNACGPEGTLYTGERSEGLMWSFVNPGNEAFSFLVWLSDDAGPRPGEISGVVYADANRNGRRDPGEAGIPDTSVSLSPGPPFFVRKSNRVGHFAFQVGQAGTYHATLVDRDHCPDVLPAEHVVFITRRPWGSLTASGHVDFACGVGASDETVMPDLAPR